MNIYSHLRGLLAITVAFALAPVAAAAPDCVGSTAELDAMASAEVRLAGRTLTVKVADSLSERAAGMQWLCPQRIAQTSILFLLPEPYRPQFHMNNVFAPLDIAFLDTGGKVLELHRLEPGAELTAKHDTAAALEAGAGSFQAWGLKVGDRIEWPASLRGR